MRTLLLYYFGHLVALFYLGMSTYEIVHGVMLKDGHYAAGATMLGIVYGLLLLAFIGARFAYRKLGDRYFWYLADFDISPGRLFESYNQFAEWLDRRRGVPTTDEEFESEPEPEEAPAPEASRLPESEAGTSTGQDIPDDERLAGVNLGAPHFTVDDLPETPEGFTAQHESWAPIRDLTLAGVGMTTKGHTLLRCDEQRAVFKVEATGEIKVFPVGKPINFLGYVFRLAYAANRDDLARMANSFWYFVDEDTEWYGYENDHEGPFVVFLAVRPKRGPRHEEFILMPGKSLDQREVMEKAAVL